MIKIKSLLAVTLSVTSLFFAVPNYGSVYAISETDETITVSDESQDVYFNISGDYVSVDLGECTAVELEEYDNGVSYEEGESTVEFSIEDESIAIVKSVQGNLVNVYGISEGETVLNAVTPDGRTTSVRIVVKYSNLVFFVTSTTTSDDADFSETNVTTVTTTSPYSAATDENGHYVTDESGRILDNSGNVLIINGTSAVMTQATTTSTTTTTTTAADDTLCQTRAEKEDATQGEIKNFLSWQLSEKDDSLTISFIDGHTQTFQKGKCNIDGIEIISESGWNVDDIFDSEQNKVMVEWLMNHPLEEIAFSDNVTDIGLTFNTHFWNTANKITFGKKVRNIGDYAFGYSEIDALNLPNSLISIGKGSFEGCANLHSVVFPESLNIIKEGAFHACLNLTDVTVLSKQVILEDYCFGFSNLGIPLDNMIIRGYKNSTAETYANKNGFTFIALDDDPDTTTTTTDVTTTETTATSDEESTVTTTESEITSTSTTIETTSSSSDTTTETNSTTTTTTEETTLPQTGYSDIYKVVIILAVLMTVSGVVIVVKTKKETE